ncbi:MAG: outer membrane lipoprotein-sorting protein [bacterium]|nr:outer membrane lipoprotein-sorting protein [bacterium]
MKNLILLLFIVSSSIGYGSPPSGEEVLTKIDRNFTSKNHISTITMVIKGRRDTRTLKSKSWVEGNDKAFTEYLAPAREEGTKMLKLKDELWTWSPSADRIIKIAGHMLRQSMMGSDISYEDFMEDPELRNVYDSKVTGEEEMNGRSCYVLDLIAKQDNVAYHSRKIWVDKERYLPLKEERFAKSGKLLKSVEIRKVFETKGRWYPKEMVLKDALSSGEGTQIIIDSIDFDVTIPEHIFSKASLRR